MERLARHPLTVCIALAIGIALAWMSGQRFNLLNVHVVLLVLLGGLSLLPAVHRPVTRWLDRLREPGPTRRMLVAVGISIVAIVYLIGTAVAHDRTLVPKSHDENSYVIQARILATGRLWMPLHPLADFFESFHMITRPVYAPIYFPGTALMNVPMAWLSLPVFVLPMIFAGAIVGLIYRIVTELVDGVAGLLAALLTISCFWFRTNSTLVMSQSPAMLLGLLLIWSWLHWRSGPTWRWSLAIGIFAGWAAITRPVDALAFAIPVGVAMFVQLLRGPRKQWLKTAGFVLLGAVPLLSLQLLLNYGTTGDALTSPYVAYLKESQPATAYGYHAFDPDTAPTSTLLQKHAYYRRFLIDAIERHRVDRLLSEIGWRLQRTGDVIVPWRVLLVLFPVAMLGLRQRGRLVVAASLPLFVAMYLPNTFYLEHYLTPLIAPAAFLIVLAIDVLRRMEARENIRGALTMFATLGVAMLAVAALPEFNRPVKDEFFHVPERALVDRMIDEAIEKPAVLLIKFHPENNAHDEPVYNTDVAWPDDAPVVRAHDLGLERDVEIAEYYAEVQPERNFYLYDRLDQKLHRLGTAVELRDQLRDQLRARLEASKATSRPSS